MPPIPQHQASSHIPAASHPIPPWSPARTGAVAAPSRSRPRSISSLSQACCMLCSAPHLRQPKLEVQKCRPTGTSQGVLTPAPATQNTELIVSFPPELCSANPTEFSAEKPSGLCHLAALCRNHTLLCFGSRPTKQRDFEAEAPAQSLPELPQPQSHTGSSPVPQLKGGKVKKWEEISLTGSQV